MDERIKKLTIKNFNENSIKIFSRENLKILYLAFASPDAPQVLEKIHHQLSVMKKYNSESGGLIVGYGSLTKKYSFEYVNFLDYNLAMDFSQFALALMDKYASRFNADIIYFRYPASNKFLYEFVDKYTNVVFEHQTKELNEFAIRKDKDVYYFKEKEFGEKVLSRVLGITAITKDIAEYEKRRAGRDIEYFILGNGTWEDAAPIVKDEFSYKHVNILFMGSFAPWHGFDRIIKGLSDYKGKINFKIHVIGDGEKASEYIELIKQYNLEDYFIFYGFKSSEDINKIANVCHFAIGSLGLHRIGHDQAAPLKHREYCLRGIPFIYSGNDVDLSNELEFVHQVPADDSNIDFMQLEKFAELRMVKPFIKQDARNYALTNLTWEIKIKKMVDFLVKLKNTKCKSYLFQSQQNNILPKSYLEIEKFIDIPDLNSSELANTYMKNSFDKKNFFEKKILITCTHFWPSRGGVESISEDLGHNFVKLGYQVDIATLARKDRTSIHYKGMNIISLDPASHLGENIPKWSIELRNLILSGNYNACILLADPLNHIIWSLYKAKIPAKTRVIIQPIINKEGYEQWAKNDKFRKNLSSILKKANIISISKNGIETQYLKEESIPFSYVPNACTPVNHSNNLRHKNNIHDNAILILHVANLWPVKNHLAILEEFRNMPDNWILLMIGYPSADSEYVLKVKSEIEKTKNIIYIPGLSKEEISGAMDAADFVILASIAESSPVTIIEAMSHGKPWIATPSCGSINENVGGIVTSLDKFKSAIKFLLDNADKRKALGILGQQQWQKIHDWKRVIRAWEGVIINGKPELDFSLDNEILDGSKKIQSEWERFSEIEFVVSNNLPQFVSHDQVLQKSLISVVVPTYNRNDKLAEAIKSIKNQTYGNFEILVINDAGEDISGIINPLKTQE